MCKKGLDAMEMYAESMSRDLAKHGMLWRMWPLGLLKTKTRKGLESK